MSTTDKESHARNVKRERNGKISKSISSLLGSCAAVSARVSDLSKNKVNCNLGKVWKTCLSVIRGFLPRQKIRPAKIESGLGRGVSASGREP